MKCIACSREMNKPTVTVQKRGTPAYYGPVCARRAFPELYGKRTRKPRNYPDTKVILDENQLELELA